MGMKKGWRNMGKLQLLVISTFVFFSAGCRTTYYATMEKFGVHKRDILKENVEDESHSTTRFVVLSREKKWAKPGAGKVITTFVFRVRNVPAALYKALGGFATNGVNMTKLESYMVGGNFFATQFYADVEGHPDDRGLAFALEELQFFSKEFRIVGVYPGHPFRATFREQAD